MCVSVCVCVRTMRGRRGRSPVTGETGRCRCLSHGDVRLFFGTALPGQATVPSRGNLSL